MQCFDDLLYMRNEVGRADKSNRFATAVQQSNYGIDDQPILLEFAMGFMIIATDLVILAKDALQVAMRKENIADATFAADHGFFTAVAANGTDMETRIGFAIARCTIQPVGMALAGAKRAI